MDIKRFALVSAVAASTLLVSFTVRSETLHSALISAYSNNPTLNAARAQQRAQNENVAQARAGRRPTIDATSSIGLQSQRSFQAGGFGTGGFNDDFGTASAGLALSQNLFSGFQVSNNIKSAQSGVRAGFESLRNTEQTVLLSAVTSYVDVIRDRDIMNLQERNTNFSREQLRAAKAQADVGEGTRTDVALAEANLAASLSNLAAAKAALRASEATYLQVVGIQPGKLASPSDAVKYLPPSLDAALNVARSEHPLIKAAQHNVDSGQFNVKVNEGTLLPSVSLNGNYQRSIQAGTADLNADVGSLTANLTVPLYQGGARFSNIRQAKEVVNQLRIEVDEIRRLIDQTVRASWAELESARSQTQSAQENVRSSQIALDGLVEERKVGEATTLDVLNAQSSLITAQVSLATARRNRIVASYSLLSSIGRFTGEQVDVAQATNVIPTQVHYKQVRDKWFGLRTTSGN